MTHAHPYTQNRYQHRISEWITCSVCTLYYVRIFVPYLFVLGSDFIVKNHFRYHFLYFCWNGGTFNLSWHITRNEVKYTEVALCSFSFLAFSFFVLKSHFLNCSEVRQINASPHLISHLWNVTFTFIRCETKKCNSFKKSAHIINNFHVEIDRNWCQLIFHKSIRWKPIPIFSSSKFANIFKFWFLKKPSIVTKTTPP